MFKTESMYRKLVEDFIDKSQIVLDTEDEGVSTARYRGLHELYVLVERARKYVLSE